MFLQILEWLPKLVDFLNNSIILSDKAKRRKIAKDFVSIYECISDIKNNAIEVQQDIELLKQEIYIENIQAGYRPFDSNIIKENCKWEVGRFCKLLDQQCQLLYKLAGILKNNRNHSIMLIYSDKNNIIGSLIGGKLSLLRLLSLSINLAENDFCVPKTFDLMDYPEFKELIENEDDYPKHDFFVILEFWRDHGMCFKFEDPIQFANHLSNLQEQINKFDSVNKLENIRSSIADMIKNNFTIEELF